MIKKRAGWLCALFLSEMLTASAMQGFESELEKAIVLTRFIPLIMSSGGNPGSQATSLLIRGLALKEIELRDWWKVALRELPTGFVLGSILGVIGIIRIMLWQKLGIYDYGVHWPLVAATVGGALVGIVTFGLFTGSMLPFLLQRVGFDPATASASFVATLVDVTGVLIYFGIAAVMPLAIVLLVPAHSLVIWVVVGVFVILAALGAAGAKAGGAPMLRGIVRVVFGVQSQWA